MQLKYFFYENQRLVRWITFLRWPKKSDKEAIKSRMSDDQIGVIPTKNYY